VLTEAFRTAATIRAKTLSMPQHPVVVVEHPMASRTEGEVIEMAERFVAAIVSGLVCK
jgi:phosphopantothenate synthetase